MYYVVYNVDSAAQAYFYNKVSWSVYRLFAGSLSIKIKTIAEITLRGNVIYFYSLIVVFVNKDDDRDRDKLL